MKRFFPSSVMLTPFVVKHYQEQDDDQSQSDERDETEQPVEQNEKIQTPS
ncbi:hypothetical protein [Vibrio tapetis]|uniref:Uncharacterized protein n=1 Tax=Vibrio tapetis subsp. tapetis TaxID=1671868 RepID=A0A2N8ZKJ7_9VIBR|nr:hypothetical protein [Vibrio tapetis]SON52439.1 conserved protein of unknown function [Vibrio tapetis subsp. tapetis]